MPDGQLDSIRGWCELAIAALVAAGGALAYVAKLFWEFAKFKQNTESRLNYLEETARIRHGFLRSRGRIEAIQIGLARESE